MPTSPRPSLIERLLNPFGRPAEPTDELVFGPEFLAQLERLRVAALKALGGGLREGHRLGAYKGGQLEFHGHRDYSPGDELRYLDWNSYARLGRPYIKEFAREEAGVLHLLLDATASMTLGDPPKFTFARRAAALFTHVALASGDAVRICVFDGSGSTTQFPRRNSSAPIQEYLNFLARCRPGHTRTETPHAAGAAEPEPLRGAIRELLRNSKRGGVMIISDFWQSEAELVAAVSQLSRAGFDPSALHTLANDEMEPHASGELLAQSVEDGSETALWFGADAAARYAVELEQHRAMVEAIFRKRGGNYVFAASGTSIEKILIATLRQKRFLI